MEYRHDDLLQLSGIQHFAFCRRQWALIHIEKLWAENYRTTDGVLMHDKAHDPEFNAEDAAGRRRLRQIAKQCVNYGQRVQCSVFECLLDAAQCRSLQERLCDIMDKNKDSLRFYYLGNKYQSKIEHFGCKNAYLPEDNIIL